MPQLEHALFRIVRVCIIGYQQDMTASHACLFEQVHRPGQRLVGTIACYRHNIGIQRIQLRFDGLAVVGQRRDRKGFPGIDQ